MIAEEVGALIHLIGAGAVIALVEKFGGERLYVSSDPNVASILVAAIGADAARTLAARYPATMIEVPLAYGMRARYHRNCGMSDGAIAVRLGITAAHVVRLLR